MADNLFLKFSSLRTSRTIGARSFFIHLRIIIIMVVLNCFVLDGMLHLIFEHSSHGFAACRTYNLFDPLSVSANLCPIHNPQSRFFRAGTFINITV